MANLAHHLGFFSTLSISVVSQKHVSKLWVTSECFSAYTQTHSPAQQAILKSSNFPLQSTKSVNILPLSLPLSAVNRGGTITKVPYLAVVVLFPGFNPALPRLTQNDNRNTWHLSKVFNSRLAVSVSYSLCSFYILCLRSLHPWQPKAAMVCWQNNRYSWHPSRISNPPPLTFCSVACVFSLFCQSHCNSLSVFPSLRPKSNSPPRSFVSEPISVCLITTQA